MLLGIQLLSLSFRLQDFHFLWCSIYLLRLTARFDVAVPLPQTARSLVWASPLSLTTTWGISFDFFSSSY
jgi:hypothetical protein